MNVEVATVYGIEIERERNGPLYLKAGPFCYESSVSAALAWAYSGKHFSIEDKDYEWHREEKRKAIRDAHP